MNPTETLVDVDRLPDGVVRVSLNRPDRSNALSIELRYELARTLRSLSTSPGAAAIVIAGRGPSFCAGMDFTQFGGDADNRRHLFDSKREMFTAMIECRYPIVACIDGPAIGGGFMLALCCDVRIATERSFFGFFEVRRAIPAPRGVFVDPTTADDWCSTGREIAAVEARDVGVLFPNSCRQIESRVDAPRSRRHYELATCLRGSHQPSKLNSPSSVRRFSGRRGPTAASGIEPGRIRLSLSPKQALSVTIVIRCRSSRACRVSRP